MIRDARSGSEVVPDPSVTALAAGLEALRHEEFARAVGLLEAAATADPTDPRPPTYLSGAYLAVSRPGDAQEAVARALALDPDGFGPHLKAGELAMRLGDIGRAEVEFLAAVRAAPSGTPDLDVARRWLAIAREQLRRSISRQADLPRVAGPLRRLAWTLSGGSPTSARRVPPRTLGSLIASTPEEDHR